MFIDKKQTTSSKKFTKKKNENGNVKSKKKSKKESNKKSNKKSNKNKIFYYLIKSEYYKQKKYGDVIDPLRVEFIKRGNWYEFDEKKPQKINPDFLFVDTINIHNKDLWKYKTTLINNIDFKNTRNSIFNKYKLHDILSKTNIDKKHLLDQIYINLYSIYKSFNKKNHEYDEYDELYKYQSFFTKYKVNILKAIHSNSGSDVETFNSFNKFKLFLINYIKKNKKYLTFFNSENYDKVSPNKLVFLPKIEWVLQEYIDDPLLFKGYKFHLRGHIIFYIKNNIKYTYLYDDLRIITARKPYIKNDYGNKAIHDTHIDSTIDDKLSFKKNFANEFGNENADKVFKQILSISRYMAKTVDFECYPENKNCYHPVGFDMMITSDYIVKIIEINLRGTIAANFKPNKSKKEELSLDNLTSQYNTIFNYKLMSGLYQKFIDDLFPSKNKIDEMDNKFIEL